MSTIEIDFDVFKELTARRKSEATTYNDVLRELLRLPAINGASAAAMPTTGQGWVWKGTLFPNGTEFRATHKGTTYTARIESNQLVLNGKAMHSPSEAATAITKGAVNGWKFWHCRFPNDTRWRRIDHVSS